ncbi:hypothetical protein Scep_029143 [Stephania cephalantha]|uniref:URB1 C-terminal domain-containing protein n=1 Tax=Stephania cephalantha TaxID=152367 RepID=A0AAP0E0N3_9MAGN
MSFDAKLKQVLHNLCLDEIKIYSEASKEFIGILRDRDIGDQFLRQYVQSSPLCSELVEAWEKRKGKPGLVHILSLISVILDHPNGKYCSGDRERMNISRRLDKFARSIIETKLEDVYMELNSKESKCQNAVLSLLAVVVRRGVGLATELAKKLMATEIDNHRHLLLNIVSGRPAFGSAYMEDFPYLLEPRASSSTWITAISIASDLVAHTRTQPFVSVDSQFDDPPSLDSSEVQCLLKCLLPNSFARIVINRGLLHSDSIVKHGTMRLLLEALKSLYGLVRAIDCKSSSNDRTTKKWISLKQEIQDDVRALLPDPQVLLKLLSSPSSLDSKNDETSRRRARKPEKLAEIHDSNGLKKLKVDEEVDILIGGFGTELDADLPKEKVKATGTVVMEELAGDDCMKATAKIWGLQQCSFKDELKDAQVFFRSKLLDALTLYIRAIPKAMDRSYDFFKLLPAKPLAISVNEQQSLLSLLIEYVGLSSENRAFVKPPEAMFKHLLSLIYLSYSPIKDDSPDFSPLVPCILRKCIRLMDSGRRKTTLPCYWLDFDLKNLLFFSQNVSNHQDCSGLFTIVPSASAANGVSFARMLHKAKKMVGKVGNDDLVRVASAFRFSTICTSPEERVENFPCLHLLHSAKMLDLLRAKLSRCSANKSVALVQLMLFWFHQIQLSYRFHPLGELKQLSEICFLLLKYMVSELLFGKFDYEGPKRACVLEVVETICNSPALTLTLSHPSCCHEEPSPGSLNISFEEFCGLSEAGIHPMDNIIPPGSCGIQRYDPAFLLHMSIHVLSNGYLEPLEFAGLGLLAVAFMSMSSPDEGMRKLGYEAIGRFKNSLESMPLFNTMFESTSVNFKKERLWILQLSYAGLNLDVDAHIFMKGGLLEILMSFYYSPVADIESKILILQIMKKSVKLPFLANYLVEQCNLISWLSSILSFCGKKIHICERNPFFTQIKAVLEVVKDVISSRTIIEWLQTYSLEQLSEFSSHALKLFADNSKMIRHDVPLVISLLKVLVSTLRISQKRKLYQPHFTLSHEGLFQLCQAVDTDVSSSLGTELGLRAMLMSTPPAVLNYEVLESFKTLFSPEIKNARTLQALLENVERRHMQSSVNDYAESRSNNEALASIILYLQQLLVVESRVLSSVVSALSLLLSYYKPWEDLTSTQTELEKIEERHACQTLIVIFSDALKGKSSELGLLPILTHQDLAKSGVFEWEKNFLIDGLSDA